MQMTIKQKSIYLLLAIFSSVLLASGSTFAATDKATGERWLNELTSKCKIGADGKPGSRCYELSRALVDQVGCGILGSEAGMYSYSSESGKISVVTTQDNLNDCESKVAALKESKTAASSDPATKHCEKAVPKTTDRKKALDACKAAYNVAKDAKKESAAKCDGKSPKTVKDACQSGASAGKSAGITSAAKNTGINGAKAEKKQSETCNSLPKGDQRTACEKAYRGEIRRMATEAGKSAGKDRKVNPCNGLKYKNYASGALKACNSAYKAARKSADQKAADQARGDCGGVPTYFDWGDACEDVDQNSGGKQNPIIALLLTILNWVTALVTVAVIGGIVYGGFLYLSAQDSSQQTQKGIEFIVNSIIALIALALVYSVINFIVPGGLFN